ncbi:MAG: hypothetical protein LBI03_09645 [Clostridiales bacterium]|jgi:hypothetical protein|nr:hypothetical protein [Clostridiales bacterium]
MKKTVILLTLIGVFALCLLGCDKTENLPNEPGSTINPQQLVVVSMKTELAQYASGTQEINVVWKNDTNLELTFGESFSIEKLIDENWETACDKTAFFTMEGLLVSPNSQREHTYNLSSYTDSISPGDYRLVTTCSYVRSPGDYDDYKLYAEFSVI